MGIIIFYPCVFLLLLGIYKFEGDFSAWGVVFSFALATYCGTFMKVKKENRFLTFKEKITFLLSTWGVLVFGYTIYLYFFSAFEQKPVITLNLLLNYFLAFCGAWLILGTLSNRVYRGLLNQA